MNDVSIDWVNGSEMGQKTVSALFNRSFLAMCRGDEVGSTGQSYIYRIDLTLPSALALMKIILKESTRRTTAWTMTRGR